MDCVVRRFPRRQVFRFYGRTTPPTPPLSQFRRVESSRVQRWFSTERITSNAEGYTNERDNIKSGTASPWAASSSWEGGAPLKAAPDSGLKDVDTVLDDRQQGFVETDGSLSYDENSLLLSTKAVQIPVTDEELSTVPDIASILHAYERHLQQRSSLHFGYPYNLRYNHNELDRFMMYSINNLGDPFVPSNYGVHSRQFEVAVIDFFAKLWKLHDGQALTKTLEGEEERPYWGYVTTCGTEGNLHGLLLARECFPDGVLYTSSESHYSVFKAARYYRMDAESIPTQPMGEMDYDLLEKAILRQQRLDKENGDYVDVVRPVIVNVNVGTTVKGAVDNLDRVLECLERTNVPRERFYIHCDGALNALMLPFVVSSSRDSESNSSVPEVSFQREIDSMTVSGHKMLGSPMPCGVSLARKRHVQRLEEHIDYLNSVDTTIMGSRNGQAALHMWFSLRNKGMEGIRSDVEYCIETAQYLRDRITSIGMSCRLNPLSCTVVLERPLDEQLIKRWQLACEDDIAHVVVMPNVTREKLDQFVDELTVCKEKDGRIVPSAGKNSPLSMLQEWTGEDEVVPPQSSATA